MKREELLKKALQLPERPGVYLMKDENQKIIYIGKAKILPNRVSSYFKPVEHNTKTEKLISEIRDFDIIITESELDALLTECSLIKHNQPFYNIKLKHGDGYYPYILMSEKTVNGHPSPVLTLERTKKDSGMNYFGPFMNMYTAKCIRDMLSEAYLLPCCDYNAARKGTGCVNSQISKCAGWCTGKGDLKETEDCIRKILSGDIDSIYESEKESMLRESEKLEFEKAAKIRDRLKALDEIRSKQKPMVSQKRNADYVSWAELDGNTAVFTIQIRNGYIIGQNCNIFQEPFSDDLLREFLERFYSDNSILPTKIYIDTEYEWTELLNQWLGGILTVPRFTSDRLLLESSKKNANERLLQFEGKTHRDIRKQEAFNRFIGYENISRMEIYDISQLAGADTVCGMVVSQDGKFVRSDYRKFRINKTDGFDDTAYMHEAVTRRLSEYKNGNEKFSPLPDIIICDGGEGQMHAVMNAIAESGLSVPVIGFKKDSRHRTKSIVFEDGRELQLETDHDIHSFCGRLQEEVHRYAIEYHRSLRNRTVQETQLTQIEGIGKTRAKALFLKFKSINAIKNATPEELMTVSGISEKLANEILRYVGDNL